MTDTTNPIKIGLKDLDSKTLEEIALLAEKTIEKYLLKHVGKSALHNLDTRVNVEYDDELIIDISAQATFSPLFEKKKDELLTGAIESAFVAVEKKLREIANE
ncbi:MAG: DUF3194 domain-containing protein [Candidatus Odinarchaeota archaeon]|nr:DUF3194 domain-containing protein [Candidatus Odinarchaeota archaeon]